MKFHTNQTKITVSLSKRQCHHRPKPSAWMISILLKKFNFFPMQYIKTTESLFSKIMASQIIFIESSMPSFSRIDLQTIFLDDRQYNLMEKTSNPHRTGFMIFNKKIHFQSPKVSKYYISFMQ
jgi:hypothetical protein